MYTHTDTSTHIHIHTQTHKHTHTHTHTRTHTHTHTHTHTPPSTHTRLRSGTGNINSWPNHPSCITEWNMILTHQSLNKSHFQVPLQQYATLLPNHKKKANNYTKITCRCNSSYNEKCAESWAFEWHDILESEKAVIISYWGDRLFFPEDFEMVWSIEFCEHAKKTLWVTIMT